MPKLLTKKGQDATDENYFIGGTVERLPTACRPVSSIGTGYLGRILACVTDQSKKFTLPALKV